MGDFYTQRYNLAGLAWVTISPIMDHNDTDSKQGGTTDQYYHMTLAEDTWLNTVSTEVAAANVLDKTATESITATYTIETGNDLIITDAPTSDTHAVNKAYSDPHAKLTYIFEGIVERDTFFTTNPHLLVTDALIAVKDLTPPPGLVLDDFPGAEFGFALIQLRYGVTNVVRVRRSSDNAEEDFTPDEITDGTLTTFTGAGDGFVVTWYDQSTNGNDATNAVADRQPQIVDTGALILNSKGSAGLLFRPSALVMSGISPWTDNTVTAMVEANQSDPGYYFTTELSVVTGVATRIQTVSPRFYQGGATFFAIHDITVDVSEQITSASISASTSAYIEGSFDSSNAGNQPTAGSFDSPTIGGTSTTGDFDGIITNIIAWPDGKDAGDVATITTALAP